MNKTYLEMRKGDVFRTEYGDYDNWVKIVFDHYEIEKIDSGTWLKTVGHYLNGGQYWEGYSPIYSDRSDLIPSYEIIKEEYDRENE